MKILILGFFALIGFSTPTSVFAADDYQNILDSVLNTCVSVSSLDYFISGMGCQGPKNLIFYVKGKEVTKTVYDEEQKNYEIKEPICDKTVKSKSGDFPKGYSASCVVGKYTEYYISGKKVSFKIFSSLSFLEPINKSEADIRIQLKKQMKVLKSLKTFISAQEKAVNSNNFSYNRPIIGFKCTGSSTYMQNGNGYKNLVCENNKVISLEYYLNYKKVSYDTYLEAVYIVTKNNINDALKNLKK